MHSCFQLYRQQYQFVLDQTRYVGFIGGIGTGKTRSLCVKAMLKALDNPGSYGVITAPTYPMLRDATKRTFFEIVPEGLIAYHNESKNEVGLITPSGRTSTILFRSTSDPDSLRGPNLLWVAMDEAAMTSKEAFLILMGRIRDVRFDPKQQQLFVATTPKGLNWVYDYFGPHVDNSEYSHYYATIYDNPFLSKEFVESVTRNFSGAFAQQELEGKFVPYEGLIYGDLFRPDLHVGDYPFNEKLPVDLAWDFGYPNPEAVLAIQTDAQGRVYIIDCIYRYRTLTEDIVAEVKAKPWFLNVQDLIADEARPDSILRLSNLGLPARASQKGKILDGIMKVRSLLSLDQATQKPILHIDRSCDALIKEFSLYRWAEKRTETDEWIEKPIDQYNHALDALRYWAVTKWFPAPQVNNEELQAFRWKSKLLRGQARRRRIMAHQLVGRR